eukprot:826895-Rhodomonas_salina.2
MNWQTLKLTSALNPRTDTGSWTRFRSRSTRLPPPPSLYFMLPPGLPQDGNGREVLGKVTVLSDPTLPELAVRDLLQARSFCFPTSTAVSQNHGGSWSTKCSLCQAAVDTYAHHFMSCSELHGAQQTMHYDIVSALVKNTVNVLAHQGHIPPRVEYHLAQLVDYLWPDCPTELKDLVPDGVIITHAYPDIPPPRPLLWL